MRLKYSFAVLMIFALTACGPKRVVSEPQPDTLSGEWVMMSWKDFEDLRSAFPTGVPKLVLNSEENRVHGYNGCNQIQGQFRFDRTKSTLQFFGIGSTRMFCQSVPENELSNTISMVNSYRVSNDELTLLRDNEVLMVFIRQE
ncbi:META domain-containing protein [Alkaliflexus imshenetskii]|jgi:heat shock protein HslJ|uniref:META domain-containing protein n=1 Tax=Alkaliflexus imshenetskii TaxID=286730 RepID=UPI000479AE85|nr:META domain-containing protein [Alkaliflexus imshenetskii]